MSDHQRIDDLLATRRYSMFFPGTRNDLLLEYPELRGIPSIRKAGDKPKDLLFVWYYACKASPAMELVDDKARIEFALKAVWGDPVPKDVHARFISHKWGEEVSAAIDDMRRFELGPRVRAKLLLERALDNMTALVDKSKYEVASMDIDDQKNYTAIVGKVLSDIMPRIKEMEGNYGVRELGESEYKPGEVMMNLHRKQLEEL